MRGPWFVCVAAILCLRAASALAQVPVYLPFQGPLPSLPAYEEVSNKAQARIAELAQEEKDPLPKNDVALSTEIGRVDNELAGWAIHGSLVAAYRSADTVVSGIVSRLSQIRQQIAGIDCDANGQAFSQYAARYQSTFDELRAFLHNHQDIDLSDLMLPARANSIVETCKTVKAAVGSPEFGRKTEQVVGAVRTKLASSRAEAEKLYEPVAKVVEALRNKRARMRTALGSQVPAQTISEYLPYILGILAGACVLAIIGIRLFSEEIQMEWVASGQVIQFVTVMVLLSVVTALALSNKLTENTLGTLLGGIAGYVLAQGVGRAAARDVARTSGTGGSSGGGTGSGGGGGGGGGNV